MRSVNIFGRICSTLPSCSSEIKAFDHSTVSFFVKSWRFCLLRRWLPLVFLPLSLSLISINSEVIPSRDLFSLSGDVTSSQSTHSAGLGRGGRESLFLGPGYMCGDTLLGAVLSLSPHYYLPLSPPSNEEYTHTDPYSKPPSNITAMFW